MGTAANLIQFFLTNMSLNSIVKFAVTFNLDSCERSCRSNALPQLLLYWDIVVNVRSPASILSNHTERQNWNHIEQTYFHDNSFWRTCASFWVIRNCISYFGSWFGHIRCSWTEIKDQLTWCCSRNLSGTQFSSLKMRLDKIFSGGRFASTI